MKNTIALRIFDFLKNYPPFSLLEQETLLTLCEEAIVSYRRAGETIFKQGDQSGKHIYVVREGAVHLIREEAQDAKTLIDQCDEGDLFGVRPLLTGQPYLLTAEAVEETLLYAINIRALDEILKHRPKAAYYLAASFAAGYQKTVSGDLKHKIFLEEYEAFNSGLNLVEIQSMSHSKAPVTCRASESIRRAAIRMSEKEVGSIIIVDENLHPLGIVTDKDLRKKVATGKVSLDKPVSVLMSSPVITARPKVTIADVQMEMIKHKIHHLCLTQDGTDQSPVIGVLSEHDLLVLQANNPAVLIREARRAENGKGLGAIRDRAEELLKKYIYQEVNIAFISSVMTEINDALIARAAQLAELELEAENQPKPKAEYCWLALGSEGRGEQLLRTDQDNALIFENVPEADHPEVEAYYGRLAKRITRLLHEAGFEYCPGEMMASNSKWRASLDQWKRQFSRWIDEPTPKAVMLCTIFFDYRPVYGKKELAEALGEHIFMALKERSVFLAFLARDALLNPPPLTFFRNFVVEKGGEHKHEFDLKLRAMTPLIDAARVLILDKRIAKINNTILRFEKLAELEPQNRELFEQAAAAYEILMRYRTLKGLEKSDSGRYFNPSELSKLERLQLRNSFRPIRELQSLLRVRFQLSLMT